MVVNVSFTALGAGQEVGRSCLLVSFDNEIHILLDCGAHVSKKGDERMPKCMEIPRNLTAIFVTHYHLDHIGSLPYLTEVDDNAFPSVEIIMTLPTRMLAPLITREYAKGSNSDLYLPIHIERCFSKVRYVHLLERFALRDSPMVKVSTFYAGHVLGGVMVLIEYKGASVLYTGDYSVLADAQLGGAVIPTSYLPLHGVDLIISESTYATSVRESPQKRSAKVCFSVKKCLEEQGIALVPVFSIGRAQELAAIIQNGVDFPVRIYTTSEVSIKASAFFRLLKSWWDKEGLGLNLPVVQFLDISSSNLPPAPCVILASPSMLESGSSLEIFRRISSDTKNLVLLTGYCNKGTVGNRLIFYHSLKTPVSDRLVEGSKDPVHCSLDYIPFTGHTDAQGIKDIMKTVNARNMILVHGELERMERLAKQLSDELSTPCLVPPNFEKVNYQIKAGSMINLPEGIFVEDLLDEMPIEDFQAKVSCRYVNDTLERKPLTRRRKKEDVSKNANIRMSVVLNS